MNGIVFFSDIWNQWPGSSYTVVFNCINNTFLKAKAINRVDYNQYTPRITQLRITSENGNNYLEAYVRSGGGSNFYLIETNTLKLFTGNGGGTVVVSTEITW